MRTRMIVLLIAALFAAAFLAVQVSAEQPEPPVIFLQRDTPAPQTLPPPITPTVTPTATPAGVGPTMTVECSLDLECEVIVYPNTSTAFLVIAVDAEHLARWEMFDASGTWGFRLWFDPPPCIGEVSRIRLLVAGGRKNTVELDRYTVSSLCTFLPVVNREID